MVEKSAEKPEEPAVLTLDAKHKLENSKLTARSGNGEDTRPLVSFLYELMRDHVVPGTVERVLRNSNGVGTTLYTNGWLMQYAQDVADRLTPEVDESGEPLMAFTAKCSICQRPFTQGEQTTVGPHGPAHTICLAPQ